MPRMFPLTDDYMLEMEDRLPALVVAELAQMGIQVQPLGFFHWRMGSFQIAGGIRPERCIVVLTRGVPGRPVGFDADSGSPIHSKHSATPQMKPRVEVRCTRSPLRWLVLRPSVILG